MDKCCCHTPCCPAPVPAEPIDFYAQYGTSYNGASGTYVSFFPVFQEGDGIRLENDTTISLKPGYLYLYSFFAPAGTERNTSASGSFTTNEAISSEAQLSFRLTYSSVTRNIDLSGAVSVTPLQRY